MLTIEKASKLLDIAFNEYPSLKDEEINIKYGKEFEVEIAIFDNLISIVKELPKNNFRSWMSRYLEVEFDLDPNVYMFYDFQEVFAFLHEIGHIYYKDITSDYKTYKSKTYNSYTQAWREYRNIKSERLADEFAAIVIKNQTIKIWSLMNEISEEDAEEEFEFWSE